MLPELTEDQWQSVHACCHQHRYRDAAKLVRTITQCSGKEAVDYVKTCAEVIHRLPELTKRHEQAVRVYCYQHRYRDAAELVRRVTQCSDEEAVNCTRVYAEVIRLSSGYIFKTVLFQLMLVSSIAVPMGFVWGLAGVVWAAALDKSPVQFGVWAFSISGLVAVLMSPVIRSREAAFAMGALFYGPGFLAAALGVIVGIIRRLFF